MYSLEELLHSHGKDSVTGGSCLWVKKPTSSTKACEVEDLIIEKSAFPSYKKKKRNHLYCQNIDLDVRAVKDKKSISKRSLKTLTQKMNKMTQKPAILPLFHKLYPSKFNTSSPLLSDEKNPKAKVQGIMKNKVSTCMKNSRHVTPELVYQALSFTDAEIDAINYSTLKQWQCEEWYNQKAGFITASKCKQVFTRQATIEKNKPKKTDVSRLVDIITAPKVP